jgi:hypothetical protein
MRSLTLLLGLLPVISLADCPPAGRAAELARLIVVHIDQARERLICDPRLVEFAEARAADMAERGYFGHVGPDNLGPNAQLAASGFPLPNAYPLGRNNSIESIVGGLARPDDVLAELLNSSRHRPQILGELPFFQEQDRYGAAYVYAPQTPEVDLWVIVFAREADPDEVELNCTPPPGACFERSEG